MGANGVELQTMLGRKTQHAEDAVLCGMYNTHPARPRKARVVPGPPGLAGRLAEEGTWFDFGRSGLSVHTPVRLCISPFFCRYVGAAVGGRRLIKHNARFLT